MRLLCLLGAALLCFTPAARAQLKAVQPKPSAATSDALGSPGIDAGDYVYVSGQGPRRVDGSTPSGFADQVRQSLENIRAVVEAAGLDDGTCRLCPGLSR